MDQEARQLPNRLTVLLTGVGAPGTRGTLYCLRNNSDDTSVRVVGTDMSAEAVGRFFVDEFQQVPKPSHADYSNQLLQIARAYSADLILPQTTAEVARLSVDRSLFEASGVSIVVGSAEAVRAGNNKFLTLGVFRALELPVPDFCLVTTIAELEYAVKRFGYPGRPVVVKLPESNGMRGLRILTRQVQSLSKFVQEKPPEARSTLEEFLSMCSAEARIPPLLVCEFLPGDEYTVDCFRGGAAEIAIPRVRGMIRSGISFDTRVEVNQQMSASSLKVAKAMGLQGVFGFQYKLDENRVPKPLECNPRIQGTMATAAMAGVNVIWMAVREAMGHTVTKMPLPKDGARLIRYWGGVGIRDGAPIEI